MPADRAAALARLLTEAPLRGLLRRDPGEAARRLDVERAWLDALDPEGLDAQAETLLDKRWGELARLLPRTLAGLGAEARGLFCHGRWSRSRFADPVSAAS